MSDLDFYQTHAGREFYERTMPELVRQITQLNELMERMVERLDTADEAEGD